MEVPLGFCLELAELDPYGLQGLRVPFELVSTLQALEYLVRQLHDEEPESCLSFSFLAALLHCLLQRPLEYEV